MEPLRGINSDDIEVAELSCNILLETTDLEEIFKLIANNKKYYMKMEDNCIVLEHLGGLYQQMKRGGNTITYNKANLIKIFNELFSNRSSE